MRIQHNIIAMNAYRNYANNTSALSKNLEKLSSGYKINRAGDDAGPRHLREDARPDHRPGQGPGQRQGRHLPGADR